MRSIKEAVSGESSWYIFFPAAKISSGLPWGTAEPSLNFRALSWNLKSEMPRRLACRSFSFSVRGTRSFTTASRKAAMSSGA